MKNKINAPVVVGVVLHAEIEQLPDIKLLLEDLVGVKIIYFKTSSEKLYITDKGR